jgi:hypothetical protein
MNPLQAPLSRRTVLQAGAALAAGASLTSPARAADFPRSRPAARIKKARKKIAVVTTAYHYLSHAYHICGRFLDGYLHKGRFHFPDYAIAALYVEQQKAGDLSKEIAKKQSIPLYGDIARALTLGGDKLAVDGVLLIGEHGDFPYNGKGQKLYPRYEMFQKIVAVFRKSGRSVPVFCDKHLYYDRKKAQAMYETARKIGFPLYAGSSLPVTWRRPELELPLGVEIKEALVASRGEIEIYGIHALEALQCMVERRFRRREGKALAEPQQGVKAVTCLQGDAVWKAGDKGLWSWELLEHALGRAPSLNVGNIRANCRQFTPPAGRPTFPRGPVAFLIEYRDGLKAAVLNINGHIDDTVFAARIAGKKKPVSTLFYLPPPPGAGFLQALTIKIEDFLATGKTPYPVERTLLTGGILDAALESRVKGQKPLETPDLDVKYAPPRDSGFMRGEYCSPVGG